VPERVGCWLQIILVGANMRSGSLATCTVVFLQLPVAVVLGVLWLAGIGVEVSILKRTKLLLRLAWV
jgi:hypothetical protein